VDQQIRAVEPGEFEAFVAADETAFGHHPDEEDTALWRKAFEFDRSLAALDGPRIVGTTAALSLRITTPGGELPMAGVTNVGVLPSHRRRGILTSLMRRQLEDVRDRGEPLAGLFASEGAIYGRFGYGLASMSTHFEADRRHVGLRPSDGQPGHVRLVDHDEALREIPAVYERVRPTRAGMCSVSDPFWEVLFADLERWRRGASAMFYVLHEASGGVDGYLAYRIRSEWRDGVPGGTLVVRDLLGETPAASAALWRYAFGVDLIETVEAGDRPADDPLLHMVAEPRRLRARLADALYLRILDVTAALAGRAYAAEGTLVLEVHDGFCPWNEGRYELDVIPGGALCTSTATAPDLRLDAADLAAAYLGGTSFRSLAGAGRVLEERPGALALAGRMFAADPPPWCPISF
jgi:predicted acetyltransferase